MRNAAVKDDNSVSTWARSFAKEIIAESENADTGNISQSRSVLPMVPREAPAREEPPAPEPKPQQQSALADGLDRIEAEWCSQLHTIKRNAEALEAKIRACVVGLRQDMARLELLGQQAMKEAERGQKVVRHFASSLDQIKSGR